MGCCQSSTVSNNDQVTLELSKEHQIKQEAGFDSTPSSYIPEIHLLKFDNLKTSTPTSPDGTYYTLGHKLSSYSLINRFTCTYNNSTHTKEAIIIRKSAILTKDCEKLIENSAKVSQSQCENIVSVFYVAEDKDFVKIITEACGEKTLETLALGNKIPFGPALAFIKQIMQGVLQFHKLGIILKYLSEKDIYLISNSVKINISATVPKASQFDAPDFENNLKNDVWNLGVLLLKLLFAPCELKSIEDGLTKLESLKLHQDDIKNIKSMFKPLYQRPSLPEVIQFKWQSNTLNTQSLDYRSMSKQNYVIEKISEELSENLSFDEEDNQSERIEKNSGSSNEFYQSEELEADDFNNEEWQEIDMNCNGKVRVCEILNDEMKEIIESIPDHEVSSIDIQSNDVIKSLPETPLVSQRIESPCSLLVIQEFQPEVDEMQCDLSIPLSNSFYLVSNDSEIVLNQPKSRITRVKTFSEFQLSKLTGTLKYFSFRKRTGLILCAETRNEYLITQDDLLISGINLQKFTKQVLSGSQVHLQFSLSDSRPINLTLTPSS